MTALSESASAPPEPTAPPAGRAWSRVDTIALAVITAVAGALRLVGVGSPRGYVFDEPFYAFDACTYIHAIANCPVDHPINREHPPLGKWLISGGVELFGWNPVGWRMASVVFGTLTVAALYLLGRRILRSTVGASLAAGLLGIDFMHLVHSRVAMLDVFVAFFTTAALLFAVLDRDRGGGARARSPGQRGALRRTIAGRPWRLAAGASAGGAMATKMSGLLALVTVLAVISAGEIRARGSDGAPGAIRRFIREEGPSIAFSLLLVPLLVYAASYIGRLDGTLLALPWEEGSWIRAFIRRQAHIVAFHLDFDLVHPYASAAWGWPLLHRPVALYFEPGGGRYREILDVGSPLAWWAALAAVAWVAVRWFRGHRAGGEGLILVALAVQYLPWFAGALTRPTAFIFYMVPILPFMYLAIGDAGVRLWSVRAGKVVVAAFVAAGIALLVFFWPVLVAQPLSYDAWRARMWFVDCGDDFVANGRLRPNYEDVPPPDGWCWV